MYVEQVKLQNGKEHTGCLLWSITMTNTAREKDWASCITFQPYSSIVAALLCSGMPGNRGVWERRRRVALIGIIKYIGGSHTYKHTPCNSNCMIWPTGMLEQVGVVWSHDHMYTHKLKTRTFIDTRDMPKTWVKDLSYVWHKKWQLQPDCFQKLI